MSRDCIVLLHSKQQNCDYVYISIVICPFRRSQVEHLHAVIHQLLSRENLSLKWLDAIVTVVTRVSQLVQPNVKYAGDDMDIRQYVQVKKVRSITQQGFEMFPIVFRSKLQN